MQTEQRAWGVAVAAILVLALAGTWAAAAPTRGGTLTVGLDQEPPTIDPHASPSAGRIAAVSRSLRLQRTPVK